MKYPWMPLYWGDFLANTMHLSAQEIGAYVLLIAHCWEHGGTVPLNVAQKVARVSNRHWAKVLATVQPFFEIEPATKVRPPMLCHRRVLLELTRADELSNKRKEAALQMHSKRRALVAELQKKGDAKPHAKGMQNGANYKVSISSLPYEEGSKADQAARSVATALPAGALPRSPGTEAGEGKQSAGKKPEEMSLAEINQRWHGAG